MCISVEHLSALNPRRVLARGYSVTLVLPEGRAVKRPADAPAGARLKTLLSEGEIESVSEGESGS